MDKMTSLRISVCFLSVSLLLAPTRAAICPESCVCSTTRDSLHRATCSNLEHLYKFTLRQKHHNINILDLSHNNITQLSHELDRLTEIVTLDLSTNGITDLNKFLHNAKKLVHLNLANNRIQNLSLTRLPTSVSSLDLTNNLLKDVPKDLGHLVGLEHLELEGNPLDCSCDNVMARDRLLSANVLIDAVKCITPRKLKGHSWLELKTKDICKLPKTEINYLDMMMGDQPLDAVQVGEMSTALKSMPLAANSDIEEGNIIQANQPNEDDDSNQYIKVRSQSTSSPLGPIEGSGDVESTTIADYTFEPIVERKFKSNLYASDEIIPADNLTTTTDTEGSGDGSGFGPIDTYEVEKTVETTTPFVEDLSPDPVHRIFEDEEGESTEFPLPKVPSIFQEGPDWYNQTEAPVIVSQNGATPHNIHDTTISEPIRVTPGTPEDPSASKEQTPHVTGTYICIALIVVILVGLIALAIIKGQMRKKRDRRLLRQQKRDVEKASREMIDMNKSLLGKPAVIESPLEKKANGKYELVPTHETHKKQDNGDIKNGGVTKDSNGGIRTDSPRDSNQNKSSSKDNNLTLPNNVPEQETSFESNITSPDSKKDASSLSSEDIFVPIEDELPRINGDHSLDASQPLINGDQNTVSDFLSPSREYVPVYSPDMGRVRIKMSETPKPKTPVLVTRSRSNAGEIIVTPALDGIRKSTT